MQRYTYIFLLFCFTFFSCNQDDGLERKTQNVVVDEDDDDTQTTIDDEYIYRLPIIFHVLYQNAEDATQYVPVSRLQAIVRNVNELFQGGVYGKSERIRVHFFLAQYDESGKKLITPGVEYVKYTGAYPINPKEFMNDNSGKNVKYIWDPNEYINVMLYHFTKDKDGQTLGVSHLPYVSKSDSTISGLESVRQKHLTKRNLNYAYCSSINSTYINSESTRYTLSDKGRRGYQYVSTDVNVTLAHELGHYLGLYHTFSENKAHGGYEAVDDCHDSDHCKDTPSYNKVAYDSWLNDYLKNAPSKNIDIKELVKRENCEGQQFESTNIMDYAIGYGFCLSPDQKHRIRQVLYYSPLIPGPKKNRSTSRAAKEESDEVLDLPIRTIK